MGCTDAGQNVDSLMFIFCGLLALVKTICFRIYAKNLTDTYNAAIDDYRTHENNPTQRKIMKRFAFIPRMITGCMVCYAYFACVVYALIPLLGDEPINQVNATEEDTVLEYTIPSRCTIEYFHLPTSMYNVINLGETFIMTLTCTCNHGNDFLFFNIALHVCGQVKILKDDFVNMDVKSPQVYNHFSALIQRHSYLIKLGRKLSDAISFVLMTQLFITSILLCIMGFQFILALKKNDVVMMGKSFVVLTSFLTQISVYSFVGDYFKSQMEEVALFLYQSNWYDLPTKLTKNLTFIIMRSQSPVMLQGGNFIVVNLETLMTILKTSMSYLSVLRVMVET